jgi:hypothetical protein
MNKLILFSSAHRKLKTTFCLSFFLVLLILFSNNVNAQKVKNEASLSISADIVSSFIWRGMEGSPTPSFQPGINLTKGNFDFGIWGSTDNLNYVREMDLFITYSAKNLSVTFSDYYWNMNNKYFDYNNSTTSHVFELGLTYKNENFPLQIYAGTMLYGDDKKITYDVNERNITKNNYSTYFELSYAFNFNNNEINLFASATPFTGIYGSNFSLVFVGLTGTKEIKITELFSLPVFATFAVNPQTENYFVVLGISL